MLHAEVVLVNRGGSSVSSVDLDLFNGNLNLEERRHQPVPTLHEALRKQWDEGWASARRF